MKILKKYMRLLASLCILTLSFIVIDAKNPITKKSIRQVRQAQQLRRTYPKNVAKSAQYRFQPVRRNNRSYRTMPTKRSTVAKNNTVTAAQKQVVEGTADASLKSVNQEADKQSSQTVSTASNLNALKNVQQPKIPAQKTETQAPKNIVPVEKNVSAPLLKKNEVSSLDRTKFLIGDDLLPEQMDIQKEESEGLQDKGLSVEGQEKINTVAEQEQKIQFLKKLSQLPSDQLEHVFAQMNLNPEQKKEMKANLANLPAILKDLEADLQNPNSPAGQAMQGKGWLEWFRNDILNYSWAKIGVSWISTAWNYTGGALLKGCGLTFSEETKKEISKGTFTFFDEVLKAIGLDTPGGALDSLFMVTLHSYFPGENTWKNNFAKTALAIGYYGAIRGMTQRTMVWKGIEAFLCTSYCKYFAQDDASYLRISYLQRPINFFYHYIPQFLRNGWAEWYMSHAVGSYKYITSLIGMGSMLAHIAMSAMDSQPKTVE